MRYGHGKLDLKFVHGRAEKTCTNKQKSKCLKTFVFQVIIFFSGVHVKRLLHHQIPVSFLWFHEYHGFHPIISGLISLELSKNHLGF